MINRIKYGFLAAFLTILIIPGANASPTPTPGGACSNAGYGAFGGGQNLLVCNGSVWKTILSYDLTGQAFFGAVEIDGGAGAPTFTIRGDGDATNYGELRLIDDTNSRFWSLRHTEAGPGANFLSLGYDDSGLTEFLTIKPTGEVGIGTVNPQTALHVVGKTRADAFLGALVTGADAPQQGAGGGVSSDDPSLLLSIASLIGIGLTMETGWTDPLTAETDIDTAQNVGATYVSTEGGYYSNLLVGIDNSGTVFGNNGGGDVALAFNGTREVVGSIPNFPSNPAYIGQIYATERKLTRVRILSASNDNFSTGASREYTYVVQGSNDTTDGTDGTWTNLTTSANYTEPWTPTPAEIDITSGISTTHYKAYRWNNTSTQNYSQSLVIAEVEFYTEINNAGMTVISENVLTATAVATAGELSVQVKDISGTAVANTDFKGYISRDNGTTWTEGTLALVHTLSWRAPFKPVQTL